MNFLEERILKDGIVKEGNVLKVDSFLNHQMDIELLDEIGKEFHRRFKDKPITKVLMIEASGIAIAYAVARCFRVPVVFAKKAKSINIDGVVDKPVTIAVCPVLVIPSVTPPQRMGAETLESYPTATRTCVLPVLEMSQTQKAFAIFSAASRVRLTASPATLFVAMPRTSVPFFNAK